MEGKDIALLIFAIVVAVLNAIAQKKKKRISKERETVTPMPNQEGEEALTENFDEDTVFHFEQEAPELIPSELLKPHAELSEYEKKRQQLHERGQEIFLEGEPTTLGEEHEISDGEEMVVGEETGESLLADFDAKKAIIYSEIIKPKYFKV